MAARRLQLLPGERVLVDIRPHLSFLSGPLVVSILAVAIGVALDIGLPHTSVDLHWVEGLVVAVPLLWLAFRSVRWRMSSLVLTSLRLVDQWGMFPRRQWERRLDDITSVTAVHSLWRRLAGTGRLVLEMRDEDQLHWIDDVRKPIVLQRLIHRRLSPAPGPGVDSA